MRVLWTGAARDNIIDAIWLLSPQRMKVRQGAVASGSKRPETGLLNFRSAAASARLPNARELVVPSTPYRLIYDVSSDLIRILSVIHGRRDWPGLPG
jgi:plasmid stabilization system protein ParE